MKKRVSKKSEEKLINELLKKFDVVNPWEKQSYLSRRIPYDWHYNCIDCDYESEYHCDEEDSSCNYDGICRCSTIENIELKDFNVSSMIHNLTDGMSNEVLIYCIDRIVRLAKLNEEDFECFTGGGYYGEEIEGIFLNKAPNDLLKERISLLQGLPDIERIKLVLTFEYGFLLDSLIHTYDLDIKDIEINKINFQDDYKKKVDISEDYYGKEFELPRGIFLKVGDRFRLIDGYHRVMKAKSMKHDSVKGIVLL